MQRSLCVRSVASTAGNRGASHMKRYIIRYRCLRCIDNNHYTWRTRAHSKREASRKFYDTEVRAWKIVSITEAA